MLGTASASRAQIERAGHRAVDLVDPAWLAMPEAEGLAGGPPSADMNPEAVVRQMMATLAAGLRKLGRQDQLERLPLTARG